MHLNKFSPSSQLPCQPMKSHNGTPPGLATASGTYCASQHVLPSVAAAPEVAAVNGVDSVRITRYGSSGVISE